MHEDGRVVLTDFELSREVKAANEKIKTEDTNDDISIPSRSGTRGFMAPEVQELLISKAIIFSYWYFNR
jgi:serine/threonine protein kinase